MKLAKEFANSMFKSADATFKICPKLFYQVVLFVCIVAMLMYNIPIIFSWEQALWTLMSGDRVVLLLLMVLDAAVKK